MRAALGTKPSNACQEGIEKLAQKLEGQCCILFTDRTPEEVNEMIEKYRPMDFARTGQDATKTVQLDEGYEALAHLPHSIEAHLRQLGMPTRLWEAKIRLVCAYTVCKEGQSLTSDQAQIL